MNEPIEQQSQKVRAIPSWMENFRVMGVVTAVAIGSFVPTLFAPSTLYPFSHVSGSAFTCITSYFNLIIAYFAWVRFFQISQSIYFRIWAVILMLLATSFAIGSTVYFTHEFLGLFLPSLQGNRWAHDPWENFAILIYFFLLPLQILVYLLSSVTIWRMQVQYKIKGMVLPSPSLILSHLYFLILATIATINLFVFLL